MQEKDFISYEYKTKALKAQDQTRMMDLYEAFGWEVTGVTPTFADGVTLSLKRDRKQKHKQELTKLERQAEDTFTAITNLTAAKTLGATIFSCVFGCIAALIFGGGMSLAMLIQSSVPAMIGGIILGIVGIALCGVNYPIYKKIVAKKTGRLLPAIDDNEEKLANLLEKGNELLQADTI